MRDFADGDHGMALIRAERGLITRLALELGINQSAVSMWDRVPAERLPEVERITSIPRHLLRPDICPPPPPRRRLRRRKKAACSAVPA